MRRPEVPDSSGWASLVLGIGVLAVLFGVLVMHQVPHGLAQADGHAHEHVAGHEHADDAPARDESAPPSTSPPTAVLLVASVDQHGGPVCEGECPAHSSVLHLCLAVLIASAGLVLAALLLARPAGSAHRPRAAAIRAGPRAGRAPPWAVLTLGQLCSLRI